MSDPLKPSVALLAKLGSLIIHYDEFHSFNAGHPYDLQTARQLQDDPEVEEWLDTMGALALVPKKRADGVKPI